jgi:RNA polymerase sigma-70 factor, ECF subfamily
MASPQDQWSERSEALAELLGRVALGDRAAFGTLYNASSAHLFGVILRINPDRGHAEDILQDIFVNIWRAAQGFDPARAQPMTWLISIARNRAIDSLRRRKTQIATVTLRSDSDDDEAAAGALDSIPSAEMGPLELLQQAARMREVSHCIGELSAEQRQCVAMAYYQGLSHSEVAQSLAQPLGTVKSWVRRALIALKECLERAPAQGAARI